MKFPRQTAATSNSASNSVSATVSAVNAAQQSGQARAASDSGSGSSASATDDTESQSASSSGPSSAAASSSSPISDSGPSIPVPVKFAARFSIIAASSSSAPPSSSSSQPQSTSSVSASATSVSGSVSTTAASSSPSAVDIVSDASGTTSFTTFVTNISGHLTTVTAIPTSLATAGSGVSTARRTAIIAGTTAAGVGLLLVALGAKPLVAYGARHKAPAAAGLLDDEGFDDDDSVPMRRYRDNAGHSPSNSRDLNMSSVSLGPPQSPAPSLFRQRAETGSLFREEGVWPPPGSNFVDPLVGVGSGDGLGKIVDEVMGPAPPSSSHAKDEPSSGLGFADPAHRGPTPSMGSLYNDPFRDISHSHSQAPTGDLSMYYDRRGASSSLSMHSQQTSGGDRQGASSSMSMHSQQTSSGDRPTTPQSLLGLPAGAATPKKSSPLASTTVPPSSATWLTRSPRKDPRRLSGSQEG
ncbi:hypothetical protein MSAN_00043100 [Mycena sanguinolenta]|uniref:Uncharacterized protein n=1 Tax=Mycena sanguinolenta TaxID=230812 RepID=A0A8H6ZEM2_9AGAR|nr:hypothetical protein MSAN_00043100 [Mycena sanguinolenta]